MAYVSSVPDGELPEVCAEDGERFGYVPNFSRVFAHRPAAYAAWKQLNGAIKATMDERRYELATLAAARRLRSSYCALAHGTVLVDRHLSAEELTAVAADPEASGLDETERAVMALAGTIADDATAVTRADVDRLRELGLSEADVVDVVLAAAVRCFFSKALDALGAEPDAVYRQLDPSLREALTVGRPIEGD